MKKLLLIVLFLPFLLIGCSDSDSDSGNNPPDSTFSDGFDENGILVTDEKEYVFNNYISSIGTFNYINANPRISMRYDDGKVISIDWKINGVSYENKEYYKVWKEDILKWHTIHTPDIDIEKNPFKFGDVIDIAIHIDNKTVNKKLIIKENKITADIYGLNFGMNKNEVREQELSRMGDHFSDPAPNLMYNSSNPNMLSMDALTLYTFNNNKLDEVGEYAKLRISAISTEIIIPEDFILLCKKLGFTGDLKLVDGKLPQNHSWNNGKVEFTIHQRSDIFQNHIGISYKKKS